MTEASSFLARPTRAQYDWADMELGLFIHWFPQTHDDPMDRRTDNITDPGVQREMMSHARLERFSARQWVQSALDLGAKYIVFVAKHGCGICRWQSQYGEMNFKNAPYKDGRGDPLAELAAECRRAGIRLGIYICASSATYGAGQGGLIDDPERQAAYTKIYKGWLSEVLGNYGDIAEVWFDGSIELKIEDVLRKYAPDAMVFNSRYATIRWVGQEEGYASDPVWNAVGRYDALSGVSTQINGRPDGEVWLPIEVDARLRKNWDYASKDGVHPDDEANPLKSLDDLMAMYYRSVGHGTNLLINHAPHPFGDIPEADMKRMKEFGDEIRRRFSHPLAEIRDQRGACVEMELGGLKKVDHVVLMEEIAGGQRIRAYKVSGFDGKEWHLLSGGSAIGHKKIDFFAEKAVSRIHVEILRSEGEPLLCHLSAFYVGEIPRFSTLNFDEARLGEYGTEHYMNIVNYLDRLDEFGTMEMRNQAHFRYELGPYLTGAGQYRLTFRPIASSTGDTGDPLELEEAWLEIGGQRVDAYVTRCDDAPNEFIVYNNGETDVVFHALSRVYTSWRIPCHSGEVLFRRLI